MKNPLSFLALYLCQVAPLSLCAAQELPRALGMEATCEAVSETIEALMELHDVPAVSACIVSGDESYFIGHGTRSRSSEEQVDERSVYQIASLSKAFVGQVAHGLLRGEVMEGNDSIAEFLPHGVDGDTRKKIAPVSFHDLLQHRSGLPRDTLNTKARQKGTYVNCDYSEADLLLDLDRMKLAFIPGEQFMYSNYGYSLLAYLCERASQTPYAQLVALHVTSPLGMPDTRFELDLKQRGRLVTPYNQEAPLVAREPARIGRLNPPTSLFSTTSDLAKMMKSQLAAYREFRKTQKVTTLILTQYSKEAWPNTGIEYGYGFFDWGNGTYGHGGGMDGYGSEFTFDPERNFGFILLTSSGEVWTQRLAAAVVKVMTSGQPQALDELVALETILAEFERRGPEAALESYRRLRAQEPSPLGQDARVTLANLAMQSGLPDAAKLIASEALVDFPDSKRIQALSAALSDQ